MSDEHRQKKQTSKTDYCTALSSLSPSHHPDSYTFWPDLRGKKTSGENEHIVSSRTESRKPNTAGTVQAEETGSGSSVSDRAKDRAESADPGSSDKKESPGTSGTSGTDSSSGTDIPHVITESDEACILFRERGFNRGGQLVRSDQLPAF